MGPYADAVERIRRAIPQDGEYLLASGGPEWQGGVYWVRFDLAPRRARYLGQVSELPDRGRLRRSHPSGGPVVVAFGEEPPLLMTWESFLRNFAKRDAPP